VLQVPSIVCGRIERLYVLRDQYDVAIAAATGNTKANTDIES